jgi:eukaryotic-like serine/threonine-protein kinase
MYRKNDLIDEKYCVEGICSDTGGMGTVLFVAPLGVTNNVKMVLEYCKDNTEEHLKRFKREVRLLASFKGNSKIVQVIDGNLEYDPPYFVMKYYQDGDLSNLTHCQDPLDH